MILEELHDKDERIGALEEQNTTIISENATIRSENATILAELASQKKFNTEIMQKLDHLINEVLVKTDFKYPSEKVMLHEFTSDLSIAQGLCYSSSTVACKVGSFTSIACEWEMHSLMSCHHDTSAERRSNRRIHVTVYKRESNGK
ncbi:hypothetical protein YC2023_039189 [Brassica napus]